MHIQGIPGIGKTHLLNALAARIGRAAFVVRIGGRWCEPSPAALCRAICREIGASESENSKLVATRLSKGAKRTLLVFDSYESFRLIDSWLRQIFLPSLGDSVRTILSSREPPRPAWRIAPEWRGLFDSMLVETFSPEVALEYLTSNGVPEDGARELNRLHVDILWHFPWDWHSILPAGRCTRERLLVIKYWSIWRLSFWRMSIWKACRSYRRPAWSEQPPHRYWRPCCRISQPTRHWIVCVSCHLSAQVLTDWWCMKPFACR